MSDATKANPASRVFGEVCRTRQIAVKSLCGGRVLVLSRRGVTVDVYGWDFGLNTATALLICRNKATCSEVLHDRGIPCVPHSVFYRPDREAFGFVYEACWSGMISYLEAHPAGVVCKPNDLSRGVGVRRVASLAQLEKAAYEVFRYSRELCLSPFVPIDGEYRAVILNGRCRLMYVKRLPVIIGDGVSALGDLLLGTLGNGGNGRRLGELLEDLEQTHEMTEIPNRDEIIRIGWRHNLSHGAMAELLDPARPEVRSIVDMAQSAAIALGVAFAAVDVANISGDLRVLEVNTGIVTQRLLHQLPEASPIVQELYGDVVEQLFGLRERGAAGGTESGR